MERFFRFFTEHLQTFPARKMPGNRAMMSKICLRLWPVQYLGQSLECQLLFLDDRLSDAGALSSNVRRFGRQRSV